MRKHAVRALAAAAMALVPATAQAATNGLIAFEVTTGDQPSIATVTGDGNNRFAVTGTPVSSASVAWSADGTALAFASSVSGSKQIYVMNADGTHLRQISHDSVEAIDPTWSPDGTQLAFMGYVAGYPAIEVADLRTGAIHQITGDAGFIDCQPRWSPDRRLIAFTSNRTGNFEITTITPSGANETTVTTQPGHNIDPAWNPRSSELAYTNTDAGTFHINAVPRTGGPSRPITSGPGTDRFPTWSPDGTRIAFIRDGDLYTVASTGETRASGATFVTGGAADPSWGPAPAPVVAPLTGSTTANLPASPTTQPVTNAEAVPVGTTVNSTGGTSQVIFKPLTTPLSAPPVTATVQGARYTIAARTANDITLKVAAPACARRGQATAARPNRSGGARVHVRGGHVRVVSGHVLAGSGDPPVFTFAATCAGTSVQVTRGRVQVTIFGNRHRVHTRGGTRVVGQPTRVIRLHAGQGLFVTRGPSAAATVRG